MDQCPPCFSRARRFAPLLAVAMASLLLAGCASDSYPALTMRPEERITGSLPPVPGPSPHATPLAVTPMPSRDLSARLSDLVTEAGEAHKAFLAQRATAEAAIAAARGVPVAAENWSVATQALSRLTVAQGPVAVALAELERLNADDRVAHAIADGNAGSPDKRNDAHAIAAAREQVAAMMDAEDTILANLHARLPD